MWALTPPELKQYLSVPWHSLATAAKSLYGALTPPPTPELKQYPSVPWHSLTTAAKSLYGVSAPIYNLWCMALNILNKQNVRPTYV